MNKTIRLSDYHVHSDFSSDSNSTPKSMIKEAINIGLSSICFTDHNDFDYPDEDGKVMFLLNLDKYMRKMNELRLEYDGIIKIYTGLEQGLQKRLADSVNSYGSEYEFDFIIGSSHLVDGIDPYYESFWHGLTAKEGIEKYLMSIADNIKICDKFDVYGHIDYIVRYVQDRDFIYNCEDFTDYIDEILTLLIYKGKGIELNTSGWKYGLCHPHPCDGIIKKYKKLGGEIITIGSDGHRPEHLAYGFDRIPEYLRSCGFEYFTVFEQRKPSFIKLP